MQSDPAAKNQELANKNQELADRNQELANEKLVLEIRELGNPFNNGFRSNLTVAVISVVVAVASLFVQHSQESAATSDRDRVHRDEVFAAQLESLASDRQQRRASAAAALRQILRTASDDEKTIATSALIGALESEDDPVVIDQVVGALGGLGSSIIQPLLDDDRRTVERLSAGAGRFVGAQLALDRLRRCKPAMPCFGYFAFDYADSTKTALPGAHRERAKNITLAVTRSSGDALEYAQTYTDQTCPVASAGIFPQELLGAIEEKLNGNFLPGFNREENLEFLKNDVRALQAESTGAFDALEQQSKHLGIDSAILGRLLHQPEFTDLANLDFSKTYIVDAALCHLQFDHDDFSDSYISGNASEATFKASVLARTNISHLHLTHARFVNASLDGAWLADCIINDRVANNIYERPFYVDYQSERPDFTQSNWSDSETARRPYTACPNDARRYLESQAKTAASPVSGGP